MKSRVNYKIPKNEKNFIEYEVKKQFWEQEKQTYMNVDAAVLYALHEEFGFGKKRLRRFYKRFVEHIKILENHYCMEGESIYLCREQLKKLGIDIEEWQKGNL